MAVLTGLAPEGVFKYFEAICGIPHGSGNTKMISDYVADFAKERNLRYIQDDSNNVIIFADGTKGYEDHEPVLLQGHLDMVCEKAEDCTIDMDKEGLDLCLKDGIISANGTTLGGDDGIAVAYMLAILDDETIPHPPLECVFTVDEEIGMLGCAALDMSPLKGRKMINLDSEEEGYFLVSCAGGVTATAHFGIEREKYEGSALKVVLNGLKGGHSGVEIDKGRGNANTLLGRALYLARKEVKDLKIVTIAGGLKDNAIPKSSEAVVVTKDPKKFIEEIDKIEKIYKNEFVTTDNEIAIKAVETENSLEPMNEKTTKNVITALMMLPAGIQRMSFDIQGLVETSLNLGILKTNENEVTMSYSVRSSVESEKNELIDKMTCLAEALGGNVTTMGAYPAWEYRKDSPLRDLMLEVYKEQYNKESIVQALHAGVECGLFAGGLPGLDAVSIGPDMTDIHTFNESMSVDSVKRVWDYILELLKRL
ncbi:MAG: aminoacyl-histidine dipeptidase [Eubacterium sp.]|nr:aminoacyl-histidine dipeptidase [Eubacterium sp.]